MAGPYEKLLGLLFHFKTGERSLSDFKNSEDRASLGIEKAIRGTRKKLHGLFGYWIRFHNLDHCFHLIPSLDVLSANL